MTGDKHTKKMDDKLIALKEPYEVEYWTKALGVSKEKLTQLVAEHGHSAANIRKALGKA
jgi:hypothetical protein